MYRTITDRAKEKRKDECNRQSGLGFPYITAQFKTQPKKQGADTGSTAPHPA